MARPTRVSLTMRANSSEVGASASTATVETACGRL